MWIRFWHQGKCSSGLNPEESSYKWFDVECGDDELKDEAEGLVPT